MPTILKLTVIAALPVIVSVMLYLMEHHIVKIKMLSCAAKQLLYGLIFGGLAVLGTEYGVDIGDAVLNVRDAAPLCAGLIFGAPAGILAGVIGGVERWFAVYWGAGEFTRFACSLATILAGLFAAAVRKYIFDDKKPTVFYGLLVGVVMETLHMLLVFLTNLSDITTTLILVEIFSVPMICLNGLSVMLAVFFVTKIGRQKAEYQRELKQISQTFQRWLAVVMIAAFLGTTAFLWILQTKLAENSTLAVLRLNIEDVKQDIHDAADETLLVQAKLVAKAIDTTEASEDRIWELKKNFDIPELSIIDQNGIITASTYDDFIGYDMRSGEQSKEFMRLIWSTDTYVQEYGPVSYDPSISRKYAGVALKNGGFVQIGLDAENFQQGIANAIGGSTRNRRVGESGYLIIVDANWNIVSDRHGHEGKNLLETGIWIDTERDTPFSLYYTDVHGVPSCYTFAETEGYYIVGVMPMLEAFFSRDVSAYLTVFMEIVMFAAMFLLVYYLIKRLIVDNIRKINLSLAQITSGNLDVTVDVRTNVEFASLSDDINSTVVTLKRYIDEAAARIDQELEYAKAIQLSAMPRVFPPYPDRREFEIYAYMRAAKEVGGDFYDFYLLGENRLVFLVADVSGKGIPAAMFMMKAKTIIKSLVESGMDIGEVFAEANDQLCENNDAGMFVTTWMGIIDLQTGLVTFANAGHNPPVLKRGDGSFAFLEPNAGFILGGLEGIPYQKEELQLMPGDTIYLYTDGVTEATDCNEILYEEERLLHALNENSAADVRLLCEAVLQSVDTFVGEAPQFDDITMLAFTFYGKREVE